MCTFQRDESHCKWLKSFSIKLYKSEYTHSTMRKMSLAGTDWTIMGITSVPYLSIYLSVSHFFFYVNQRKQSVVCSVVIEVLYFSKYVTLREILTFLRSQLMRDF